MDNLDPDDDKTMNRLKKSMNDEANAVLQDQDNLMMDKIMNFTKFILSKLLYAKNHKNRHGWAKKGQIFSYL